MVPADTGERAYLRPSVTPSHDREPTVLPDIEPRSRPCMRCGRASTSRFYGCCGECTDELNAKYPGIARDVTAAAYEPKMNVTPNAVALKDD